MIISKKTYPTSLNASNKSQTSWKNTQIHPMISEDCWSSNVFSTSYLVSVFSQQTARNIEANHSDIWHRLCIFPSLGLGDEVDSTPKRFFYLGFPLSSISSIMLCYVKSCYDMICYDMMIWWYDILWYDILIILNQSYYHDLRRVPTVTTVKLYYPLVI